MLTCSIYFLNKTPAYFPNSPISFVILLKSNSSNSNVEYKKELVNDYNTILEHMSKNKEFKLKEQELAKQFAPFGSERLKVVDKAFSTILENLFPEEYKILFKCSEAIGHKRTKITENEDQIGKYISFMLLSLMLKISGYIKIFYSTIT